ncbi:MAG: hypothetical protein RIM84_21215 [Alphaproteobacteria bacterium]
MIARPARLMLSLVLMLASAAWLASPATAEARHRVTLPEKPTTARTVHVCRKAEQDNCFESIGAALAVSGKDNIRVVVHCGHYRGDSADLTQASNLVIEGAPCGNGRLPILDAAGRSQRHLGAYPWLGQDAAVNLWVEGIEFRGNHVSGNGAPFHIGGSGEVMLKNIVMTNNDNGVVVSSLFAGTVYIVDSVFRDNGYGSPGRTHHVSIACRSACLTVVLDSYFGKILQGGNHIQVHGDIFAIGNMFIDEPTAVAARMIDTAPEACRVKNPDAQSPCLVAENYMLKNHDAISSQFINVGASADVDSAATGIVIRDNVALSLRDNTVLVGNLQPNTTVLVRSNLLVVKDTARCTSTGLRCLISVEDPLTTVESNIVSGDPSDLPTLFLRRDTSK